jgi:signal transduction histidine kinase
VAVTALLLAISAHIPVGHDERRLDVLGYLLLVAAGVSMAVCRRWPRTVTAVATAVLCLFILRHYPNGPVWAIGWVALGALSWRASRRTAVLGAVAMLAALSVAAVVAGSGGLLLPLVFLGWSAAAVLLGEALRNRRTLLLGLQERARFMERSREEEAGRRVAEERLRIARDLHDGVAHAMATINVQAGAAAHVLDRRPEAARDALAAIARASGDVLDELTAMLTLLRQDGQPAERAPTPGLADIARLAASTVAAGLSVEVSIADPAPVVPAVIGTAAYRVVQESLTNVLRHSRATTVRVRLTPGPQAGLVVSVVDPGPAKLDGATGSGVGLRGMSERVATTGGRLHAGPTLTGGFEVRAEWNGRA